MTAEKLQLVALVIWLLLFLGTVTAWILSDRLFLESYRRRYGGVMSDDERLDALLSHPPGMVRKLPGDTLARMNALSNRLDDPEVERLRRRTARLLVAVGGVLLLGFPGALLLVAVLVRVIAFSPDLSLRVPGVVIAVAWIALLASAILRGRATRPVWIATAIGVLAGAGVALLLPSFIGSS